MPFHWALCLRSSPGSHLGVWPLSLACADPGVWAVHPVEAQLQPVAPLPMTSFVAGPVEAPMPKEWMGLWINVLLEGVIFGSS